MGNNFLDLSEFSVIVSTSSTIMMNAKLSGSVWEDVWRKCKQLDAAKIIH